MIGRRIASVQLGLFVAITFDRLGLKDDALLKVGFSMGNGTYNLFFHCIVMPNDWASRHATYKKTIIF